MKKQPDPISTSPLAVQASKLIEWLRPLVGPVEAQSFMQRSHAALDGETPVALIKAGEIDRVVHVIKCLATELGCFGEPWLPPHAREDHDNEKSGRRHQPGRR